MHAIHGNTSRARASRSRELHLIRTHFDRDLTHESFVVARAAFCGRVDLARLVVNGACEGELAVRGDVVGRDPRRRGRRCGVTCFSDGLTVLYDLSLEVAGAASSFIDGRPGVIDFVPNFAGIAIHRRERVQVGRAFDFTRHPRAGSDRHFLVGVVVAALVLGRHHAAIGHELLRVRVAVMADSGSRIPLGARDHNGEGVRDRFIVALAGFPYP